MTEMNKRLNKLPGSAGLLPGYFLIGLLCFFQLGCDSSSSGGSATPSAIVSVSPENNNYSNLVTTVVTARFNVDMDPASVATAFKLSTSGMPVSASVSYNNLNRTATLAPDSDLSPGVSYRASVASSVMDINGNMPLVSDYAWNFGISESIQLVSKTSAGSIADRASEGSDIDGDGRYTVFETTATNLWVTTNGRSHIYRKDNVTGELLLVSADAFGNEANNDSFNAAISNDGRYVVFESAASNLDAAASLGTTQIFLKDLSTGAIRLVSCNNICEPDDSFNTVAKASISDDGQYVVFESRATNLTAIASGGISQVYRKNTVSESVEMISRTALDAAGNGASTNPAMSSDGTHIVFESIATNLNGSSGVRHIYHVDTNNTHAVITVSVDTIGMDADGNSSNPSISDDGSVVVFDSDDNLDTVNDTNGSTDVYLRALMTASTSLVSANPSTGNSGNGVSSNAQISGNGDFVVFESLADDLAAGGNFGVKDIFVRNLMSSPTVDIDLVNNPQSGMAATADTDRPVISQDGRYVSFDSTEPYATEDSEPSRDVYRAHNSTVP